MREPLINDEEPRGAGDAFIESMTPRSRWERSHRVEATRYYIDGRVYIWARASIFGRARQYIGARVYIWARHVYIWARHDVNASRLYIWARHEINAIDAKI